MPNENKVLTHIDPATNQPQMVDVSDKTVTKRSATARSIVVAGEVVMAQLTGGDIQTKKGPVFQTAIIAGTMAAKKTSELVPFCHPIGLDNCKIHISVNAAAEIVIECTATVTAKTGVEMEALTGASVAALTVYDMCKALSHDIVIRETRLVEKTGGKSDFKAALPEASSTMPPLYGLVLAGGQSSRMGTDKGLLQYHGQPQREYAYKLLQAHCEQTFISCNSSQASGISLPKIEDRFLGIGPIGGLLSAFQSAPGAAWLVVATDLPFLNPETLEYLIAHRNPAALATAFQGYQDLPEPLLTIWEPRAYPVLLQALGQGVTCPRKVLLSGNVQLLKAPLPEALQNINNPTERESALQHLSNNPS